jgi:predicted transcriptional regulator YheO
VHDVTDPEHSLIAIRNGLSGREPGNPMTDLSRSLVERAAYAEAGYLANYTGCTKNGDFLSSTYYIKNEGRLIGLLCINKDMSAVQEANNAMRLLLERFNLAAPQQSEYTETLDNPIASMLHARIAGIIAQDGVTPARMSPAEKVRSVHRLKEDGVLTMKGAIADAAEQLSVSVPTIYRYLSKEPVR